ncbi:unnamed protein product [Caenorhabditis angaria]|uniref:Uncharacterized protein n=1 Tax=Caenorhabditis angaria TaxID=860376 RepID=A0A9P1N069_9PELO|nr:unnamed protein product [Caenorhabditis angaria]
MSLFLRPVPLATGQWQNISFEVPILVDLSMEVPIHMNILYFTEISWILMALFTMTYFTYFLHLNSIFHQNLIFLLGLEMVFYFFACFSRIYLIFVQLKYITDFDTVYFFLSGYFRFQHYGLAICVIPAIAVERSFATYYVADYESKNRPLVTLTCLLYLYLHSQIFSIPIFLLQPPLLFTMLFAAISMSFSKIILTFLKNFNLAEFRKLSWKAERHEINYTIGKKFQVEENLRVMWFLRGLSLMFLILIIIVIFVMIIPLVVLGRKTAYAQFMIAMFDYILAMAGVVVPIICLIFLRKKKNLPIFNKIRCFQRTHTNFKQITPANLTSLLEKKNRRKMANMMAMIEKFGELMNLGACIDFLPVFQCEAMLEDFAKIKRQEKSPTTPVYLATSLIWRHQSASGEIPEKSFIDVRFSPKYYYQLILTQSLEQGKPITTLVRFINRENCENIIDARPAVEVAHEWVAGLLRLFNYANIDIAPPCINLLKAELKAEGQNVTIRGYWDSRELGIVESWLGGFKLIQFLTLYGGPSAAQVKHSKILSSAHGVTVHGLSDIDDEALLLTHGPLLYVYGTTLKNVTGCGLNDLLTSFKKLPNYKREIHLEGCLEPNFQQRIIEHFRSKNLLRFCTFNVELNEMHLECKEGDHLLTVETHQNKCYIKFISEKEEKEEEKERKEREKEKNRKK